MLESLIIYVFAIALVAAVPEIIDIILAYWSRNKLLGKMLEKSDSKEQLELLKAIQGPPPGIPGLTRGVLALTVIVVLGVAVIHILVEGAPGDDVQNAQIINNVLSMLAGLLAAIAGFYFGGKAAVQDATKNITKVPESNEDKKKK